MYLGCGSYHIAISNPGPSCLEAQSQSKSFLHRLAEDRPFTRCNVRRVQKNCSISKGRTSWRCGIRKGSVGLPIQRVRIRQIVCGRQENKPNGKGEPLLRDHGEQARGWQEVSWSSALGSSPCPSLLVIILSGWEDSSGLESSGVLKGLRLEKEQRALSWFWIFLDF